MIQIELFRKPFTSNLGKASTWHAQALIVGGTTGSTSSALFRLADPQSPTRALKAVRDARLHRELGDFDDHLEDASIDWLKNQHITDTLK